MGAGSKKKHEANHLVAPTVAGAGGDESRIGGPVGFASIGLVPELGVEGLAVAHEAVVAALGTTLSSAAGFAAFSDDVEAAKQALYDAQAAGATAEMLDDDWQALTQHASEALAALEPEELNALAAEQGFEHPGLVGLHLKVFWLNPAHDAGIVEKAQIQELANLQYAELQAGHTVEGLTLAGYLALYPEELEVEKLWSAEELDALFATASERYGALVAAGIGQGYSHPELANDKWDFLDSWTSYQSAVPADPSYEKETYATGVLYAATRLTLSEHEALVDRIESEHGLSNLEQHLLLRDQGLVATCFGTPQARAAAHDQLESRTKQLASVAEALPAVGPTIEALVTSEAGSPNFGSIAAPEGRAQLIGFATSLKELNDSVGSMGWINGETPAFRAAIAEALDPEGLCPTATESGALAKYLQPGAKEVVATPLRQWLGKQPMGDLRLLAEDAGLAKDEVAGKTRAQLQNYVVGLYDPKSKAKYEASLKPTFGVTNVSSASNGTPIPAATFLGGDGAWGQRKKSLLSKLQYVAAQHAAMPDRPSAEEVAELSFHPAAAPVSGGVHAKSFWADEQGRTWMHKPDKGGKINSSIEVAASELISRAGLPSVPVYRHTLGGEDGSVQPIISHSGTLEGDPSSWSQNDVDAIVKYHVASWMVGDHDVNKGNILRTSTGSLVQIDHGQSWKFLGQDKLDVDYHPTLSLSGELPTHTLLYKAAKEGKLAPGVKIRPEAALPVIEAFEGITDYEVNAIVKPLADRSAGADLTWVATMRKRAQAKKADPTAADVAEEFVSAVVERKNNLRKDFTEFFGSMGLSFADMWAAA